MNSRAFFNGMATLTTAFQPEPSEKRDELYRAALDDLTEHAFLVAVAEIVKTLVWFPKIAEIRVVAERVQREDYLALPIAPTPCERAWGDLCSGVPSEAVERVIAVLGGWDAAFAQPLRYVEFVAAYNGVDVREQAAVTA